MINFWYLEKHEGGNRNLIINFAWPRTVIHTPEPELMVRHQTVSDHFCKCLTNYHFVQT